MEKQEIDKIRRQLTELRLEHERWVEKVSLLEHKLSAAQKNTESTVAETTTVSTPKAPPTDVNKKIAAIKKESEDLEFHIGGTWLNRIGVVAVIIGIALFLKYSIDNGWIGPTGRVLMGVAAGIAMMVTGEKLRSRFPGYAQGLLGGGSLAIFFAVYASYAFYQLISPVYAFVFLVLVMINTVFMAIRHNALSIGILGIIGGYAIPIMIGSDDPSLWVLFGYLTLLTTAVLAVSVYQRWSLFRYLSFLFNQVIFGGVWISHFLFGGGTQYVAPSLAFLVVIFALYLGVATVYNIRTKTKAARLDIGLILLNAFAFFAWSLTVLDHTWVRDYTGFYAVILALIYIYLGRWAYSLFRDDQGQVFSLFAVSFVLITIAIPLQLNGVYIGLSWLAEAVALAYIARRIGMPQLALSGLLVLLLGWLVTFDGLIELIEYYRDHTEFFINGITFQWIAAIAFTVLFILLTEPRIQMREFNLPLHTVAKAVILLLIFVGITVQNTHFFMLLDIDYFISPEQLSLSALWIIYAIVLFVVGVRKNNRYLRYVSLGLFAIVVVKAFFVDLAELAAVFRIMLFIVLGVSLLGVSYFYQKEKQT